MIVYSFKNTKSKDEITETKKKEIISSKEENNMLAEMMADLEKYKTDLTELVMHRKHFENENFKKTFFPSLENLLNQVNLIREKKLKEDKIENVYKWYKTKWKYFNDLNHITKKTKKFDYENHPSEDDYKKSDYYEAGNYPLLYERDNRTEESGIMPPKDRLKKFTTKKITIEKNREGKVKEKSKTTTEKERLLSAADSAMRSTNTTNLFNTNTKFYKSKNEVLREEIKSSYSTYRPQYNLSNLTLEKITETTKHRELAHKRNMDEMKEFLNEFGMNRAKFKSEVEKKIETKIMIKHYVKNMKDISVDEFEQTQEQKEKFKRDTIIKNNTSRFSSTSTIRRQSTIRIDERRNTSTLDLAIQKQIIIKPKDPIQTNTSNIKNLNAENKLITNPDEIVVNIKMKNPNIKNKELLFKESKAKDSIPLDLMAVNTDRINDLRNMYSKMLNVKEVDTGKENYKDHFTPLSAYDSLNVGIFNIAPCEKKTSSNRPLTSYEYVRNNFDSNDLLKQRKSLSRLKVREMNRLTETVQKNKKQSKLFSQIQEAFMPHEDEVYPKYYLPFPDYGMLSKPIDIMEKKRRVKGK